jgi:DNA primase
LKAGLSALDAGKLGAYYHPPTDRVVLPVLDPATGTPVFWQARAVDGRVPKYLAPSVDRTRVVPQYGKASEVTLTEDILSAYKVGTVGEGWSLMGTSISAHCLTLLLRRGAPVNVWLDDDAPGRRAGDRVMRALTGAGLEARRIRSKVDPKLVHRNEIKELICSTKATS